MNICEVPKSVASQYNQIIDRRKLIISGNYFALTEEQRREMTLDFYDFVTSMTERFGQTQWRFNSRPVKDIRTDLDNNTKSYYTVSLMGDFPSEFVYNKKTLKEYSRCLLYPPIPEPYDIEALGYNAYYSRNIEKVEKDPAQYEQAIYRLFEENGYSDRGICRCHDYQGFLISYQLAPISNLFYGTFEFEIQLFCIGKKLDDWICRMADTGTKLSEKYGNINILIEINPAYQSYLGCFSKRINNHLPPGVDPNLLFFAEQLYLPGVGIYNFVSSKTIYLCGKPDSSDRTVEERELSNGNMVYWLATPPNKVGVEQLKNVKKKLYGLILPSGVEIPKGTRLRERWEIIPVLDQEIHVTETGILISHHGSMDFNRLLSIPGIPLDLESTGVNRDGVNRESTGTVLIENPLSTC